MTPIERRMLSLVNDELKAIALTIETLELATEGAGAKRTVLSAFLAWRLATYYRMETELKETRALLLAQEDA